MNEHRHPCDDFTITVAKCHRRYGKLGEDCVREELAQKKCFAQLYCKNQAYRFYEEKGIPLSGKNAGKWNTFLSSSKNGESTSKARKVSCANLVEVFAKPENELLIPEGITKDDRIHCRKIVHDLATCLSTKKKVSESL